MRRPSVDDFVMLVRDVPDLLLRSGDLGVVRSTWFSPTVAYEVEFEQSGQSVLTRALLLEEQVQVIDQQPAPLPL